MYLTPTQAAQRLAAFLIDSNPSTGDLRAAERSLEVLGPFVGVRYDASQLHAFPRSVTLPGDVRAEVPPAVLDWLSLEAHKLSREDEPPVLSEGVRGASETYASPKRSRAERLQDGLLSPYLLRVGALA